jgi:hypothetical protein
MFSAAMRASKEKVLSANDKRFDGALSLIIINIGSV